MRDLAARVRASGSDCINLCASVAPSLNATALERAGEIGTGSAIRQGKPEASTMPGKRGDYVKAGLCKSNRYLHTVIWVIVVSVIVVESN